MTHFILKKRVFLAIFLNLWVLAFSLSPTARAESQGADYKGITDPFGDPTAYEFAEDEKADKEFFHLGRYLMLGLDFGLGSFTGGLGQTNEVAFYAGGHIIYFFDKSLAFEVRGGYARHQDSFLNVGTSVVNAVIPITAGFRFYPDVRNAPRAVAISNPYLALGGGLYIRKTADASGLEGDPTNNTGAYAGGGLEFPIYRRHIFFGADLRYHFVQFDDESDPSGNRAGNYFTTNLSFTYNY
ncbi:MAG: hypothetical protein EBQ85_07835 [Proteobacteria bacterium]|nr:hypothetical protein [Pseudomonadota bacterium]